jgi:hypothetical protein
VREVTGARSLGVQPLLVASACSLVDVIVCVAGAPGVPFGSWTGLVGRYTAAKPSSATRWPRSGRWFNENACRSAMADLWRLLGIRFRVTGTRAGRVVQESRPTPGAMVTAAPSRSPSGSAGPTYGHRAKRRSHRG